MTLWGSAKEDTYFTSLDSMKGYHQVKMVEGYGSKEKGSFYLSSRFISVLEDTIWMDNAPATFLRLSSTLLAGQECSFVFVYLDDLRISGL